MSNRIDLTDLPAALADRGPAAFLVTVGAERPHVVAVEVESVDGRLEVQVGPKTVANVGAHPAVTLLWPADDAHPANSLLVDGEAEPVPGSEQMSIVPVAAVLHRAGGRSAGGPC